MIDINPLLGANEIRHERAGLRDRGHDQHSTRRSILEEALSPMPIAGSTQIQKPWIDGWRCALSDC